MQTFCTVTTTSTAVAVVLHDPALLEQLPPHFPLRFRPLRGPHLETSLVGDRRGFLPAYVVEDGVLRILRADLVAAMQKAGAAWPGQIGLRDDTVILTQLDDATRDGGAQQRPKTT